ncbi:hypothetical protein DLAC_06456 [Tieghemostelium lacteum]|uniref:Uncharacterized protein n=1 Tax=Tieghemostelium lacteum TaxID=361077 RepID=A0A151ZES9_TIELA|nr:hypothetical protein DLAC_06456 [Tieghemostelium lacteum]|eukprot:KYQ92472.1 hypothetical protein DLAC_06456 [Tieghemostelium lacteum]
MMTHRYFVFLVLINLIICSVNCQWVIENQYNDNECSGTPINNILRINFCSASKIQEYCSIDEDFVEVELFTDKKCSNMFDGVKIPLNNCTAHTSYQCSNNFTVASNSFVTESYRDNSTTCNGDEREIFALTVVPLHTCFSSQITTCNGTHASVFWYNNVDCTGSKFATHQKLGCISGNGLGNKSGFTNYYCTNSNSDEITYLFDE